MPSRISDERELRRGLILGLTLAEVLLLLLFLLLLALASKLQQLKGEADQANARATLVGTQLKPLQEALLGNGALDITGVQRLVERFQRMTEIENEIVRLKADNAELSQFSELSKNLSKSGAERVASAVRQASKIDPNDPPALLKRALDVLEKLGNSTKPEDVKPLSELKSAQDTASRMSDATATISALQGERDKLKRDISNLMRTGNGLTYPSCWSNAAGQTEFIFDIVFGDEGITVQDATPARAQDAAWNLIESFPRGQQMNEQALIGSTAKLFAWSKQQNCRFYTIIRDGTGDSNKKRYKYLQKTVESHFYPLYSKSPISSAKTGSRSSRPSGLTPTTQDFVPTMSSRNVDASGN